MGIIINFTERKQQRKQEPDFNFNAIISALSGYGTAREYKEAREYYRYMEEQTNKLFARMLEHPDVLSSLSDDTDHEDDFEDDVFFLSPDYCG